MGEHSALHWALIMFVIGAAIGFLIGSGTIAPADLLDPIGLANDVLTGLTG